MTQTKPVACIGIIIYLLLSTFFANTVYAQSPGNVSTSLELWLKADAGVTGSSPVTAWADQSGNALNATAVNSPTLTTDGLNFNPTITFDGTSARFTTATVQLQSTNSTPLSLIVVFDTDNNEGQKFLFMQDHTSGTDNIELGYDTGDGTGSGNYGLHVGSSHATIAAASTITSNTFNIMSSLILNSGTSPSNINIYKNGQSLSVADDNNGYVNSGSYNTASAILNIGARDTGTPDAFHDGDIAEVIVYSQQLSASDRQKIESYLAIKYGITIDQTSATDYLASDAGTIWDGTANASYNTDITGIGRDDNSALDQRKSASVNSNAILTIANGDITTPVAFSVDDSWLVWGSDNGATTFGTNNINNADGTTSNRMTRIWRVDETGTVGNVEISFDNSLATGTVSIVIDQANTFLNNANRRIIEMTDSGSDYEVTVDFADGEYFSFANASASTLSSKSVLINEIITEPQQDWSSGNFYDAAPGGSGTDGTDEWIELYVVTAGLDLSSWTIELNDGTDVSGDLSSTGAFDVSNYLSTSGGTITNTAAGDYIILGNVDGSGAMNNTGLTVNLKNASSLVIDQVLVGSSAPSGNSTDTTDESVSRIPNGEDTNDNSNDFTLTRATLGTTNSPTGSVKINEVVTDPQTDWSTNSFNGTDGMSTVSEVDEYVELYIGSDGLNLTGWTIELGSFSGDLSSTGAFDVSNYSGSGSFINTTTGDYLVMGNPDGSNSMGDSDLIVLKDASGTEVDRVQLGGGGGQAPSGNATSASDEAIVRYTNATDTDADDTDFIQTVASLGATNSLSGTVLINEVVTDPQQDWSTNGFDGTVAGGTVDTEDEWLELYIGTAGINLTNWTIELTDGTNVTGNLTSTGAFDVSNYTSSGSGSFLNTAVGDYLVLGNVDGSGDMSDDILITLKDATGATVDEIELGDDPASDGAGDGAPDGSANGGDATGTADESISRIPNATDTGNDVNDFSEAAASLGASNAIASLPGVGNGLAFGGTDDYVSITQSSGLPIASSTTFTVEMWVNGAAQTDNRIFAEGNTGDADVLFGLGTGAVSTNKLRVYVRNDAGGVPMDDVSTTTVYDNTWHHIAYVKTGASTAQLFVDGVLDATDFDHSTGTITPNTTTIGALLSTSLLSNFTGNTDEARIWSDARTQEEIVENMNTTLSGTETNLVAYYNFDQSSGTSLPDITSNNNDGTLTNMAGSEWTAATWNTYAQNAAILQSGGSDVTTGTSGELTLTDVAFLNDNDDILLIGHENSDFSEVTSDLPSGTLITARYDRNWHVTKNDASGTSNGNVTFSFDLGATPNADYNYYLLERTGTSGDFSIVPVDGINPSGTSVVFTVNTSQIDDGSYYTLGRSDAGVGNSLEFDGTDDYVDLGDIAITSGTVEMWIYTDDVNDNRRIYSQLTGATTQAGPLGIDPNTAGNNSIYVWSGSSWLELVSLSTDWSSAWHHLAVVYSGGSATGYWDGVQQSTQTTDFDFNGVSMGLGAQYTGGNGDEFSGQFDEVRIWSDARTHAEIVNNMHASLAGDDANLVGYYRMNQGIGNNDANLPDLSGDNNNGTATNFNNLNSATASSNYITSTRTTFSNVSLIANGGTLSASSDELTLTSTQTAGDFLQDSGDQIIWSNDDGAFTETASDVPSTTLLTNRITKTWYIDKEDVSGTAHGNVTFSFDLGASPTTDYTYYLLSRSGTSGDFAVVEVIDSEPNGNSIEFTVDGAQITDQYYYTLGRSDSGAGNAVDLDGSNDYVLVSDGTTLDITSNLTLEAWIDLGTTPPSANEGIVAKYLTSGNQESYTLDINTSGNVVFDVSSDGSTNTTVTSSSTISTGTPTHIAAVYTPSTSLQIYINGMLDAENTTSIPASLHSGSADLWIGASSVLAANNSIDASIDEIRVWNTARTKTQIQDNLYENLAGGESGLVAYYRFNQGDAGNTNTGLDVVPDRSGNANSGTLTNLALSSTSSNWLSSDALVGDQSSAQSLIGAGNALDFDGTDDYVSISDVAALDITGTLTIEAWLNLGTTPGSANEGIVAKFLTSGNQESYSLDITTGGNAEFIISDDGSTNTTVTSSSTISTATWTHIAAVFSPSSSMQLYIDGVLDNENTTSIPSSIFSSTADLWIGISSVLNANNAIDGSIDEVRIWNTARTAVEIQDNMFEALTGSETGLVAYYQFDEIASTTSLPDESTNSNTGTLNMDPANDWVDASGREPFKSRQDGNWNTASTWRDGAVPNASSAIVRIGHDVTLDANISVDRLLITTGNTLTLNSSQTLTVSGNMINNGTITGAGGISFAGTAAQNLDGGTYSNLTLNNSSADITLLGDANISGTLTLTNGNLIIGDNTLTINSGGSISGGSSSSYIQTIDQHTSGGFLRMQVSNGAGSITFPVGTSTYTPFSMINLGSTVFFGVRVFNGTYTNGIAGVAHVTDLEINRTWDVRQLGVGYNMTITLQWNGTEEDASFNRASMFVSRNDVSGWWDPITGTIAASGSDPYTVSVSGVTSFSQIAGGSGSSPLPVTFIEFRGTPEKDGVALEWSTATEINNDRFEVERSADGENFSPIGEVTGYGNSSEVINYQYFDARPYRGINYYRLRQVDYDGSYEYSEVITVQTNNEALRQVSLFPNPSKRSFTLRMDNVDSPHVRIKVLSLAGEVINEGILNTKAGSINEDFGANLKPGIYMLEVRYKDRLTVMRMAKQ